MSDLVGNPEDRSSHNEAQLITQSKKCTTITALKRSVASKASLFSLKIILWLLNCYQMHSIVVFTFYFSGWFKLSKGLSFTKPAPHYNIEDVSKCPADFFLCTTQFYALLIGADSDSGATDAGHSRIITEGEVLRKDEVHTLDHIMIPQRFRKLAWENKFLLCIDERDMEVYIPLCQTGLFHEVSNGDLAKSNNCVLQILDILDEMIPMPLYVRHILGDPPPVSQFYSPCLKLHRMVEEETIMGSTLDRDDLLPFEIQTNSPITFEISLNTLKVQTTLDYAEAFNLCKTVAQNYVTDMKLAVTFSQVEHDNVSLQGQDNIAVKADDNQCSNETSQRSSQTVDYDGQSEDGEVDALSEFTIQWDPGPRSPTITEPDNQTQSEKESECDSSIDSFQNDNTGRVDITDLQTDNIKNRMKVWKQELSPFQNIQNTDISTFEIDFDSPDFMDIPPIANPVWTWEESSYNDIPTSPVRIMSLQKKNDLNTPTQYDADSEPSSMSNITIESTSFRVNSEDDVIQNNSFDLQLNGNAHYAFTGDVYMNLESDDDNVSISDISTDSGPSSNSSGSRTLILTPSSSHSQELETLKDEPKLNPWLELERKRKQTIADLQEFNKQYYDATKSEDQCANNDAETERNWKEFCFDRTLSLPHKTKSNEQKGSHIRQKHSNSWEQVSPRSRTQLLDMSVVSAGVDMWTPRSMRRYNSDCANYSDKSQLISDTSSEDSLPVTKPNRLNRTNKMGSFRSKEDSKLFMSTDKVNFETQENDSCNSSVKTKEAQSKSNIIAQILMLKDEMKKNTFSEWNEISEII